MKLNQPKRDPNIKHRDFLRVAKYVEKNYGLKIPDYKKYLIQSRLLKRINSLGMSSFSEYIKYLFDPQNSDEIQNMIDVVTTHKTDFFREKDHFEFINKYILPQHSQESNNIKIWSAGASTGEEAYTLAIVISEFNRKHNNKLDFEIYGSDVSLTSIKDAARGVYPLHKISVIPMDIVKRYFLKNKNPQKKLVKVSSQLQKNVHFFKLNFFDKNYNLDHMFDIIMCRNTLIYFERETQKMVLNKLLKYLKKDGFLIIGHSESIFSMNLPVKLVKTTIFKKI